MADPQTLSAPTLASRFQDMPAGATTRHLGGGFVAARMSMLPVFPIVAFVMIALAGPLLGRDPGTQDLLNRLAPPV
ncbi:MAG: hypothetical protein M3440_06740, partial [Chloroflexota bacterium]|nr:hypothetical protein [Chloroflexota bacterium]